ncbi:RNA-binding domain-containing protein [Ramaria rubella]|nr:RNA-binding domain-containing protein [Ramaria rubella]
MSQLDDDLYGDLYGADDNEFAVPVEPERHPAPSVEEVKTSIKEETSPAPAPAPPQQIHSTSPPADSKPIPVATSPSASAVSHVVAPTHSIQPAVAPPVSNGTPYSTQVAQQFSTYQHIPSSISDRQERLPERAEIPQVDTTGERSHINVVDRSVRPSEMKDEGKMFVGGLNWDTTDETLRQYFSEFGKVDACTIMRDASGRSRGFAFLTFEDPAAVNAVMVREHYLDGKIIDPKRAIPRQEHNRTQKVFVGGLAPSVTNESMRHFFNQFGKVIDATVMIDRDSSRSKGFGFVTFDEKSDVERLIGMGGLDIEGKVVEVKLAQPRGTQMGQNSYYREGSQGGGHGGMQGGGGGGSFTPAAGPATGGQTPFDPQALAQLYQRMFQQFGGAGAGGFGGGMNPMMGGMGMSPMMGGGAAMGGMGGMGMGGYGRGMGGVGGAGMMMGGGMGGGMGRGTAGSPMGATPMNPNIPRGPRGAGPPTGPQGGVGPQRTAGGQHRFHPYGR